MNAHRGTPYQDAFAVVSGLDRLQGDLEDVANEGESWRAFFAVHCVRENPSTSRGTSSKPSSAS